MFPLNTFDANLYLLAYPLLTVISGYVLGHDTSSWKPTRAIIKFCYILFVHVLVSLSRLCWILWSAAQIFHNPGYSFPVFGGNGC